MAAAHKESCEYHWSDVLKRRESTIWLRASQSAQQIYLVNPWLQVWCCVARRQSSKDGERWFNCQGNSGAKSNKKSYRIWYKSMCFFTDSKQVLRRVRRQTTCRYLWIVVGCDTPFKSIICSCKTFLSANRHPACRSHLQGCRGCTAENHAPKRAAKWCKLELGSDVGLRRESCCWTEGSFETDGACLEYAWWRLDYLRKKCDSVCTNSFWVGVFFWW